MLAPLVKNLDLISNNLPPQPVPNLPSTLAQTPRCSCARARGCILFFKPLRRLPQTPPSTQLPKSSSLAPTAPLSSTPVPPTLSVHGVDVRYTVGPRTQSHRLSLLGASRHLAHRRLPGDNSNPGRRKSLPPPGSISCAFREVIHDGTASSFHAFLQDQMAMVRRTPVSSGPPLIPKFGQISWIISLVSRILKRTILEYRSPNGSLRPPTVLPSFVFLIDSSGMYSHWP